MKLPHPPPTALPSLFKDPTRLLTVIREADVEPQGKYLHWDQLRRRTPPADLSPEEWWHGVSFARSPFFKELSLRTTDGRPFQFGMTESAQSLAHEIDRDASGVLGVPAAIANKATQRQYLVRSLIEEALTSSQLEGAAATRAQAKQMIQEGRKPRNKSERMVLNNYWAMEFISERKDQPLSLEMLLDLHRTISLDTLDAPDQVGRLRTDADHVRVIDHDDDTVLHVPPPATELTERIRLLCDFANGGGIGFIHPVVRAVLLHFWLGYDHPFCDGNGRTARALFYWSMLQQGYWLTEYVSISRVLKQAPAKYSKAFLYSETAPYDVTYFVLHQLEVVKRSIIDLHAYLAEKMAEVRSVETILRNQNALNHRQIALLSHALRNPGEVYTMATHKRSHRVSHETARQDLYGLEGADLLVSRKRGRQYEFIAVPKLAQALGKR